MNKFFVTAIIIFLNAGFVLGQELYFKGGASLHTPITTQQMPKYFDLYIYTAPGMNHISNKVNFDINEFSIASGYGYNGAIGYSFNSFISCELLVSYFKNTKNDFEATTEMYFAFDGETRWEYSDISFLPTILIGQSFNKSAIFLFAYSGIGISNLNVRGSAFNLYREYHINGNMSFTWGYGIDYSYNISPKTELFTRLGINNTYYTPQSAKLVSSSDPIEDLNPNEVDINYVEEIDGLEVTPEYQYYENQFDQPEYYQNPNTPELRLKETLRLNSFFIGVGIKYNLSGNEK